MGELFIKIKITYETPSAYVINLETEYLKFVYYREASLTRFVQYL